ncbi:MAG: DNA replication protein DnaC [Arcticibacterium sp.]|jgi:DNA replication protein DnaC
MAYKVSCNTTARLFSKLKLAKTDLLNLDNVGFQALSNHAREALLDIIDRRSNQSSTFIGSQISVSVWYVIGEGIFADVFLDRLINFY